MNYAEELQRHRATAGVSQIELARRADIAQPNISAIERGRQVPSVENAARLAGALGFELAFVPARRARTSAFATARSIADANRRGRTDLALRALIDLSDRLTRAGLREQVLLTEDAPPQTGDSALDAAIAALVEYKLPAALVPDWVRDEHRSLDTPTDPFASISALPVDHAAIPDAFLRHGALVEADTLASV